MQDANFPVILVLAPDGSPQPDRAWKIAAQTVARFGWYFVVFRLFWIGPVPFRVFRAFT